MDNGKKKRKKGPIPKQINKEKLKENDFNESNETEEGVEVDLGDIIVDDLDHEYKDTDVFDNDIPPPPDQVDDDSDYGEIENETDDENEPPEPGPDTIDFELKFSSERSYLYIFGPSSTGKTVLISSILNYLKNYRSDTLINLNNPKEKHEKEGNRLWNELRSTHFENKFPRGTEALKIENIIPRHINVKLIVNDNKKSDFEFCFIDMSGEDLSKVKHDDSSNLPDVIKAYIENLPKDNICFTYILDPQSDFLSKTEQLNVFDGFIDLLDTHKHTGTPLLFLVSKWDLIANSYADAEQYIKQEFSPIWGTLNEAARKISYAEFSIGEVDKDNKKLIKRYDPKYAEKVFNWFYKNQTGDSLIHEATNVTRNGFKKFFKK